MQIFYPDVPDIPLPAGHRFPASKYALLRAFLSQPGRLGRATLHASPAASRDDLLTVHDATYVDAILNGEVAPSVMRVIGFPWSETLVARSRATVGGTLAAARSALRNGFSGQLAGGTHHAHRAFGSGYCVFNDCAIAARTLLNERAIARVAIVDLDVHQGDGNSALLAGEPQAFVFSMQGARNFPFRRVPSTLDIELDDGAEDATYLRRLDEALPAVSAFNPDLVLYIAGVDPLAEDKLGRLALTHAGLAARDERVFDWARQRATPLAVVTGGGYADPIALTVEAYANTFDAARRIYGF